MVLSAEQIQRDFENYLQSQNFGSHPKGLYDPIHYSLSLGGKRLRPTLLIMAYNMYKDNVEYAYDAATAMEIFHNFTLLHDDVMDNATMRRGAPTVHRRWNTNTAILSGDGMLIIAYSYLTRCATKGLERVLEIANSTFLEIMVGQQFDLDFELRDDVLEDEYIDMIRLKTSVLLAACMQMGSVLGGATEHDSNLLYKFGERLGLAFQLQDDLLDTYGNPKMFGKNIGGDIVSNKRTFLYINAYQMANQEQRERLDKWYSYKGNKEQKIAAVRGIYDELSIRQITSERIEQLFSDALELLQSISVPEERRREIMNFALSLLKRKV